MVTRTRDAGSALAEALVGLAVAVVDLDLLAVAGAPDVEAAPGLHAGDGAVAVDVPLLVALAVAAVDLHGGAVAGAGGVEAGVAVHLQLFARSERPGLVGLAVAVVELDPGAVVV